MASKAAARHHMIRHLPMTRRTVTVAVSAVVAVAVMAGYFVADIYDVAPGILTLRGVDSVAIPDPQDALTGGTVAAGVDASMPVDAQARRPSSTSSPPARAWANPSRWPSRTARATS